MAAPGQQTDWKQSIRWWKRKSKDREIFSSMQTPGLHPFDTVLNALRFLGHGTSSDTNTPVQQEASKAKPCFASSPAKNGCYTRSASLRISRPPLSDDVDDTCKNNHRLWRNSVPILPAGRRSFLGPNLPQRARSMFRTRDKDQKAMMVWRDAVAQQQRVPSPPTTPQITLSAPLLTSHGTRAKDAAMCSFIIHELYATEKSYFQLLDLIHTRYMCPMILAARAKDPLVKASDVLLLFRHLPDLLAISDKLLEQFGQFSLQDIRPGDVARIFCQVEQDLVVFLRYAMHCQAHAKTFKRACNSALVVKIQQESQKRYHDRLGLDDFFIAPIQRVPRYCLLLHDLLRHTPMASQEAEDLEHALKTIRGLAQAMDLLQKSHSIKVAA